MRLTNLALTGLATLAMATLGGCTGDDTTADPHDPGPLAQQVASALAGIGELPTGVAGIEFNLFNLDNATLTGDVTAESCDAVDQSLETVCGDVRSDAASYCYYNTAFFYANNTPRCAVRVRTGSATTNRLVSPIYMLDFSGVPRDAPAPLCGNGVLDEGEECDDGNHELWDGCDSQCINEPFNGCEAVIEDYFQRANLAHVDKNLWDGPRSHTMVNRQAVALREVTPATCAAAISTADDVCRELEMQMPFVSWCEAGGTYHDTDGPACSIRLEAWFQGVDPAAGAYTTSLPGILAFTIR